MYVQLGEAGHCTSLSTIEILEAGVFVAIRDSYFTFVCGSVSLPRRGLGFVQRFRGFAFFNL
jgi:hypothetical protein